MDDADHLLLITTCPDEATAETLATAIVEAGLAACVNIVPAARSIYRWKGAVEAAQELLLVIKTRRERYAEIERRLVELHPYELPELIAVPIVAGSKRYLSWVDESVAGQ